MADQLNARQQSAIARWRWVDGSLAWRGLQWVAFLFGIAAAMALNNTSHDPQRPTRLGRRVQQCHQRASAAVPGAIRQGQRWSIVGPIMLSAELVAQVNGIPQAYPLGGSQLVSLTKLRRREARRQYLLGCRWLAEIQLVDGELTLVTDKAGVGLLGALLDWQRPADPQSANGETMRR